MEITCINCPVGCRMTVQIEKDQEITVTGNGCNRGLVYAKQECTAPLRMVTASLPVEGCKAPVSVKTRTPIPKQSIFDCMAELGKLHLRAPIQAGQVVCPGVCGSGVDVIATRSVP